MVWCMDFFECIRLMDIIYLKDFRVDTVIGIYAWEQAIRQTISVDIEVGTSILAAASSDNITDTLNYATLATSLSEFINAQQCALLETLAQRIADFLQQHFAISWLRLKLNKIGAVPNAKEVGVIIERSY